MSRASTHFLPAAQRLVFADVLVPDGWIGTNVVRQKVKTFRGIEVDYLDTERAQPVHATLEIAAFADDDFAKTELADEAAAIPAGSKGGDQDEIAVAALAAGAPKSIGFAVKRWITILHAPIMAGTDEFAIRIENCRPDGNPAFGESFAGFRQCDGKE